MSVIKCKIIEAESLDIIPEEYVLTGLKLLLVNLKIQQLYQ